MVRAGKLKSGAAKKVNRWSSSSQSNPGTTKHRSSALARKGLKKFQDGSSGATGLTADNLRILDRMTGAVPREEDDDLLDELDLKSEISGASFRTFVSGVTDCTNMTFNRVKAHWEKNPEKHKEVVAVLAAITEVIREKGLKDESEAAYFAVLSTTLTQVSEEETLAAVSHLFSLNLRKVAPGVINKNFSSLVQMFMSLLVKGYNSTALMKSLVSCLGTTLKRGTTYESWSNQDTKSALQALLAFVLHPKPKVRKAAQKGAALLIHTPGIAHSCVEEIARFSLAELQKAQKETHTLQLLTFFRATIYMFPLQQQKELCQACLKLLNLQSQMVRVQALRTINEYLRGIVRQAQKAVLGGIEEGAEDVDQLRAKLTSMQLEGIPTDLIGKLLSALKEVKPSSRDVSVCSSWLEVVFSCCFCLATSNNPRMAISHLPNAIENCYTLLDEPDNGAAVGSTMQKILSEVAKHLTELDLKENAPGDLILKQLVNGLQFQYSSVMDCTLDALSSFYVSLNMREVRNKAVLEFLASPLKLLAQLRLNPLFSHKIALDNCAGSILSCIGPEAFLTALPIDISGNPETDGELPYKWIIPILESKLRHNVYLDTFFKKIATLATKIITAARALDKFQAAPYFTLHKELWALFPEFCQKPCDGPHDLLKPANAKGLDGILTSPDEYHHQIKPFILSGLRKIVNNIYHDNVPVMYRLNLGKFGANYMKTMLELYRSRDFSANAMSAAKEWVKITPKEKLAFYYKVAQDKAQNEPEESLRPLYWDIAILVTPWLHEEMVNTAFAEGLAMARNDSALLQKKAWRVLEQIASTNNKICKKIMKENEDAIIKGFMSTLGSVAANARKPRIQLLEIMLPALDMDTLNALISELVLCTKDKNAITRALAYTVLTKIAARYVASGEEGAILPYMQTVLQGLTGNPLTVACTLNVLNISLHEFRREIPPEIHEMVLDNVLLLMDSNAREILKATVSFLITLTKILDKDTLAVHVEKIVTAVVNWKKETRNPFRVKVRRLLERLIKKFGFEIVVKFIPDGSPLAKMLANAKKIRARNERRRAEQEANEESDDEEYRDADQNLDDLINDTDSEDDDDEPKQKKSKSKKFTDQLMETEDGEVVDLSAAHAAVSSAHVRSKRQRKEKSNDSDDEIGSAPDGRIIVREKKNKKEDMDMLSSDDEEGLPENIRMSDQKIAMSEMSERGTKGKKREQDSSMGGGEVYQSKKAKGDVKRKNKHDPYSYLPLRKDMLNKRKKHSGGAVPGLKNIVKGAKRGAQKGKKNRTRK